ncbi:phage morphogeneis protein [Gallibacterium anatis]|uniref:phage virion morphogenesis protein n=1 Tax=Gallibacterium anatis TaxID=750 RepID=UPI000531D8C7|nr:phage virion morphogenesis protein [Gallibacterium anatis]KGQ56922.1 phage morphogeneis protein [Gallibacterium anatis]
MIKITLDDHASNELRQIVIQLQHPKKLYGVLGETLKKIHKERFKQEVAPDGKKWQALSPITRQIKGNNRILKQDGYLSQKTAYNYDEHHVEFGSDAKYARLHQFGGKIVPKNAKRLRFGESKIFAKKADIPARPWLGVNDQDKQQLLNKATALLQRQLSQIK